MGTYDVALTLLTFQAYLHHKDGPGHFTEDQVQADLGTSARMAFWLASGMNGGMWGYGCPGLLEDGEYGVGRIPLTGYRMERHGVEGVIRFRAPPPVPEFLPDNGWVGGRDRSNSQYAVLGLKAASNLGVELPESFWIEVARGVLSGQAPAGEEVDLLLQSEPSAGRRNRYEAPPPETRKARVRGWSYSPGPPPSGTGYGSMTTSGLATARICLAQCQAPEIRAELEASLLDGWAWMARHFTVQSNPADPPPGIAPWAHFYYLYGLERAGVFCRVRQAGDHDWYVEGAEYLLGCQGADGAWPDISSHEVADISTCFALLFLKRASGGFVRPYEVGPAR